MANPAHSSRAPIGRMPLQPSLPLTLLCTLILFAGQLVHAQTFSVIHSFTGGGDGAYPLAGLTVGPAGNFYGTTFGGGNERGVVFQLTRHSADWVLTPLYTFAGGNDGAYP